ncbi:hypothetical protein, partial [Plebeiibacterium marinum]|nr:hypothetical protein [Plebeiobacterium marinum]
NNQSNRLLSVADDGTSNSNVKDYDAISAGTYTYDSNGNMTHAPSKDSENLIKYNHLNLPQEVSVNADNRVFYHYDAAGNKLAKYVKNGTTYKTTDYIANLVYTDGQKSFFSTEEGRAIPVKNGDNT